MTNEERNAHIRNRRATDPSVRISEAKAAKKWQAKNREHLRDYAKKYRDSHREHVRAKGREFYQKNKKSRVANVARWLKRNPHKMREYTFRRKALKRNGGEDCSKKISVLMLERFCHWCCRKLDDVNRTIDHVIPLYRGGKHISDNLVAACRTCNCSRGHKLISEWDWETCKEAA